MKKDTVLLTLHTAQTVLESLSKILSSFSEDKRVLTAAKLFLDTSVVIGDMILEIEEIEGLD